MTVKLPVIGPTPHKKHHVFGARCRKQNNQLNHTISGHDDLIKLNRPTYQICDILVIVIYITIHNKYIYIYINWNMGKRK